MSIGHVIHGEGSEGVIVLHGWFGDHTVFQPTFSSLDKQRYCYAFLDYRGYGLSTSIAGEYTLEEIAQDALALADELGWQRFHLLGHSMGGAAVQAVLAAAPERVKSLVAITPVPASGVPFDEEGYALFDGAAAQDANRKGIIDFTTGNRLSEQWLDHMVRASRETTTQDAFAGYFKAWGSCQFQEKIQGKTTPVLVLVGEHDQGLTEPLMQASFMQQYPNASLTTLPNSGHYPMQETPVHLVTVIQAFFAQHT